MKNTTAATRTVAPCFFFVIMDGKNPQSENVLEALWKTQKENCPGLSSGLHYGLFATTAEMESYARTHGIDLQCAVHLFDANFHSRTCFSPFSKGLKRRGISIPSDAQWGVGINARIPQGRIPTAARQICADFLIHFGRFECPWGKPITATRSGKERREKRRMRKEAEKAERVRGELVPASVAVW